MSPPLIEPGRLTVAGLLRRAGLSHGLHRQVAPGHGVGPQARHARVRRRIEKGPEGWNVDFTQPIAGGPNSVGFDYYFGIAASLDMVPYTFIENDRVTVRPTVDKSFAMMSGKTADAARPGGGRVRGRRRAAHAHAEGRRSTSPLRRPTRGPGGRSSSICPSMPRTRPSRPRPHGKAAAA